VVIVPFGWWIIANAIAHPLCMFNVPLVVGAPNLRPDRGGLG